MRGTWYIVPTPFSADGALDLTSLERLIEAAPRWGVDGLTVMGVMAEPGALSADERAAALTTIFDANAGRLPIVVGCSGAAIGTTLELIGQARALGAAGAMVAAPRSCAMWTSCPTTTAGRPTAACPWSSRTSPMQRGS